MKTLSQMVEKAVKSDFFDMSSRGRGDSREEVSYLLFGDDILILCEASED